MVLNLINKLWFALSEKSAPLVRLEFVFSHMMRNASFLQHRGKIVTETSLSNKNADVLTHRVLYL